MDDETTCTSSGHVITACCGRPFTSPSGSELVATSCQQLSDSQTWARRFETLRMNGGVLRQSPNPNAATSPRRIKQQDGEALEELGMLLDEMKPSHILSTDNQLWINLIPGDQTASTVNCVNGSFCPGLVLSLCKPNEEQISHALAPLGINLTTELVVLFQLMNGFCEALPGLGGQWRDVLTLGRDYGGEPLIISGEFVSSHFGGYILEKEWDPSFAVYSCSTSEPLLMNRQGRFGWWRWKDGDPVDAVCDSPQEVAKMFLPYFRACSSGSLTPFERAWLSPYEQP
ncbi:MAG: hypothetical protein KF777_12350 [Planctomycetaceae bacterium]|nr:hypothetical protein [Planctomycetaceae bacterium]